MFDVTRLRIFDPEKVKEITLDQQSADITRRILPHIADTVLTGMSDPPTEVQQIVRKTLPRLNANGWTEERYVDTMCIWEIEYGPYFERAAAFDRVPRFYVRAHETQHAVFADMMVTLRAAEQT